MVEAGCLVRREADGDVVRLTLDCPERANALGIELVEALLEAVNESLQAGPKALVLCGSGKSFCAGFDLTAIEAETDASIAYRLMRIELLLQTLYCAPCYTIALVHGTVAGAGADLVAACRKRIGAPGARFRFPGVGFGLVLGTRRLVELIGQQGYEVLLEQRTVEADEAARLGLLSEITAPEEWPQRTVAIAERLERVPQVGLRGIARVGRTHELCDQDMGALARSLLAPGLQERICDHAAAVRASKNQAPR